MRIYGYHFVRAESLLKDQRDARKYQFDKVDSIQRAMLCPFPAEVSSGRIFVNIAVDVTSVFSVFLR